MVPLCQNLDLVTPHNVAKKIFYVLKVCCSEAINAKPSDSHFSYCKSVVYDVEKKMCCNEKSVTSKMQKQIKLVVA